MQPEQVGNYSVLVSNNYGTALSSNASLSIIDSPYLNSIQSIPGARNALISWKSSVPSDSQVQFNIADSVIQSPSSMASSGFYRLLINPTTNGNFSGSFVAAKKQSGFAEAACGVNRIYVK